MTGIAAAAVAVTGVIVTGAGFVIAVVVTRVITGAGVAIAAVVTRVIVTGAGVAVVALAVVKLKMAVVTGADVAMLVAEDDTFMASPSTALAVVIG